MNVSGQYRPLPPVDPNPLTGAAPPPDHGHPIISRQHHNAQYSRLHPQHANGGSNTGPAGGGSSGSLSGLFNDLSEFANGVADAANSELRVLDSFGREMSQAAAAVAEALPELERAAGVYVGRRGQSSSRKEHRRERWPHRGERESMNSWRLSEDHELLEE